MIEPCRELFPTDFHDEKNSKHRVRALINQAFRLEAEGKAEKLQAGEVIAPHTADAIEKKMELAKSLYSEAIRAQTDDVAKMTKFQKMKPFLFNSICVVVVAAEILSIPILLANIYMMCKPKHHGASAAA